ncbi:hypothetical protein MU1_08890 [Paenibacillus glycanilyticus]|uniref:Uncharacterized protein n=1 Tax=Paenibacillus glycanilyticus TaxID=126569 RepID=A0ABQ6G8E9_9BACL|nr:hypothetical protein MU1_08890 [Paenibacillus glycanilyticus]
MNGGITYSSKYGTKLFKVDDQSIEPFQKNETLQLPKRTVSFTVGNSLFILMDHSS